MTPEVFAKLQRRMSQLSISLRVILNGAEYQDSDFIVYNVTSNAQTRVVQVYLKISYY